MDELLLQYVNSGNALLLIGSGPSNEMKYPSWKELAEIAINYIRKVRPDTNFSDINRAFQSKNFPLVFKYTKDIIGDEVLRKILDDNMTHRSNGNIYNYLAQWPIKNYLTTNYDDEILKSLSKIGESYIPYSNSNDHFALLNPSTRGAIFKLHGDFKSANGLILTSDDYDNILKHRNWEYWRTKMTSIFQFEKIIIIGHSLYDPNIKHILKLAKKGTGFHQPIVWISPDINFTDCKEYIEKYRIHVLSYDNSDGSHNNLRKMIQTISDFIPSRVTKSNINTYENTVNNADNLVASSYFVYNKLFSDINYEKIRAEIIVSIILSVTGQDIRKYSNEEIDINEILLKAGWPESNLLNKVELTGIIDYCLENKIFIRIKEKNIFNQKILESATENNVLLQHERERFKSSILLRLNNDYSALDNHEKNEMVTYIDNSMINFFQTCGLTLSTLLFAANAEKDRGYTPAFIIRYFNNHSCKYDSLLKRQAFFSTVLNIFKRSTPAERDYLGKLSQGFFAYHALGVFGDVAKGISDHAQESIWIIDSSMQISALALCSLCNSSIKKVFTKLKTLGIRLFTTYGLFHETFQHLLFANQVIRQNENHLTLAAATGQPPYKGRNEFIVGYLEWQIQSRKKDWNDYINEIFETESVNEKEVKEALTKIGIEVIDFKDWTGFNLDDDNIKIDYTEKIVKKKVVRDNMDYSEYCITQDENDHYRKSSPEAEVCIIIEKERNGEYNIKNLEKKNKDAWFISNTSIINNAIEQKITWPTEAFIRFISSIANKPKENIEVTNESFEAILLSISQSGFNLINESKIKEIFGSVIDQSQFDIEEQKEIYRKNLGEKYSQPVENVLKSMNESSKMIASVQLKNELIQKLENEKKNAEERALTAETESKKIKSQLEDIKFWKDKYLQKTTNKKKKKKK